MSRSEHGTTTVLLRPGGVSTNAGHILGFGCRIWIIAFLADPIRWEDIPFLQQRIKPNYGRRVRWQKGCANVWSGRTFPQIYGDNDSRLAQVCTSQAGPSGRLRAVIRKEKSWLVDLSQTPQGSDCWVKVQVPIIYIMLHSTGFRSK